MDPLSFNGVKAAEDCGYGVLLCVESTLLYKDGLSNF